jgi:hypothetical protein
MSRNRQDGRQSTPAALGTRVVRRLLWLTAIAATVAVVGFILLIGAWIVLQPKL